MLLLAMLLLAMLLAWAAAAAAARRCLPARMWSLIVLNTANWMALLGNTLMTCR